MPPLNVKIYHITHLGNLPGMVDGVLWSDAERLRRDLACQIVGMSEIKRRRLEELEVGCHRGTRVGHYVPFYFCVRSVMLFLLYKADHPELSYRGGQRPIVHLEADLNRVVEWANSIPRRWAFSNGNAGTRYTAFYNDVRNLNLLNWESIAATDWKNSFVKEGKQSEFLIEESFPWELVEKIGVIDQQMAERVQEMLGAATHKAPVVVERNWYY